jgi:hypothetical protein
MQKLISAMWAVSIPIFWLNVVTASIVIIARVSKGEEFWTATGHTEACLASAIVAALAWLLATAHQHSTAVRVPDPSKHV